MPENATSKTLAADLIRRLQARMKALHIEEIPGQKKSSFSCIRRNDRGLQYTWRSNGSTGFIASNPLAIEEFLGQANYFIGVLARAQEAVDSSRQLAAEMEAAGVGEIAAHRKSEITRVVLTGHPWGLCFTWNSNGHTGPVFGNVTVAEPFLQALPYLKARVRAHAQQQADRERSLIARGTRAIEKAEESGLDGSR